MGYYVELFDDFYGFITFDVKKNEGSAVIMADVVSQSRKCWMRVTHAGVIIEQFDRRETGGAPMNKMECSIDDECDALPRYSVMNLIDDGVYFLIQLLMMMTFVVAGAMLWGVFNPQIRASLLTMQNYIFGGF